MAAKREMEIPVWHECYPHDAGYARDDECMTLVTTSTVANQAIGAITPPVGEIFRIQAIVIEVYYTTFSAVAAYLGTIEGRWGADCLTNILMATNTSSGALFGLVIVIPTPGFEVLGDGVTTINFRCTPTVVTSITWKVTVIGYRRLP